MIEPATPEAMQNRSWIPCIECNMERNDPECEACLVSDGLTQTNSPRGCGILKGA